MIQSKILEKISLEELIKNAGDKLDSLRHYRDEEDNDVWEASALVGGEGWVEYEGKSPKEALVKLILSLESYQAQRPIYSPKDR